jgi:competence ComEA-like helix-hairpin-helix protein
MWKDFFYFSKSQRIGIVVLIGLIVLLLALRIALPRFIQNESVVMDEGFKNKIAVFQASLKDRPTYSYKKDSTKYTKKETIPPVLFYFNPNTLDSAGFVKLGIKPYVASRIVKYRAKSGRFKTLADFAKVYGILPAQFALLEPYIIIPAEITDTRKSDSIRLARLAQESLVVELNSADTTELKKIKGVGISYAKRIIAYRNILGGFVSPHQLLEVWGMSKSNYEKIAPHVTIDSTLIRKIEINKAGIDRLRSHPYLNFYHAKAIYELRRNKGKLKSINDLQNLYELPDSIVTKIEPYLDFR